MKIWRNIFSALCLLAIATIIIVNEVELFITEDCSICGHLKCHAPCILNLSTGEIKALELYMPHDQEVGELAEEQTGGTFSFISVAGLHGVKLTDPWYIELEVPMVGNKKRPSNFCNSCRQRLENYKAGFVLMDIYDLAGPLIYRIEDGASYEMRCYKIVISANQEKESFLLRVDGTL